jgi:hypothetical protein
LRGVFLPGESIGEDVSRQQLPVPTQLFLLENQGAFAKAIPHANGQQNISCIFAKAQKRCTKISRKKSWK